MNDFELYTCQIMALGVIISIVAQVMVFVNTFYVLLDKAEAKLPFGNTFLPVAA